MPDFKDWLLDTLGGRPHTKDKEITTPPAEKLQQDLVAAKGEHEGIQAYSGADRHPADIKAEEAARQRVNDIESQLSSMQSTPTEPQPPVGVIPTSTPLQSTEVEADTPTPNVPTDEKAA